LAMPTAHTIISAKHITMPSIISSIIQNPFFVKFKFVEYIIA